MTEQITYTREPDNCREVAAWVKERGLEYDCELCHGTGEYETEYGPKGCQLCCSRLVPLKNGFGGLLYADWGDTIVYNRILGTALLISPRVET